MGRSKPPTHSSAPQRAKVTEHITKNSSLKMNTFIKNVKKQCKSNAPKMNTMQMDPPGGRRRMGRATKVQTPESESSLSPVEVDSSNDAGHSTAAVAGGVVNTTGSECRRSSRKKTIKFDVRDLLNKNRKSHKIQIEARIDSNAPKSGSGPASKEELDNKQKTFIEKSAIFRRYSFSENKQPPRPPPPPVALIKTIQQCVGELEQLPLDRDIDLAAISPIARRLSKTQEILTASMMKPKQVNSLIVTKLENATTSTPTTTRRGSRQKASAVQSESTSTQLKRRGRPKKGSNVAGSSESTTESSNDSSDISISETAIISSPNTSRGEEAKSDEDSAAIERCVNVSPTSSTKDIDLREKTDASAVTLSPSELMEPNMFVGAEEEVFTQGLSSDESTVFLRSSPKEKSNDEVSLFGRSDSTETNSSDDSERRRKKIRVAVKRVTLPSALLEHVDLMLKSNSATSDVIEVMSSNDDESLNNSKEANESVNSQSETSSKLKLEDCVQDNSKIVKTRASSKRLGQQVAIIDGDNSNTIEVGSVVEVSSDSTATPVDELLGTTRAATSAQTRMAGSRRINNSRRKVNEHLLEEQAVQPHISVGIEDCRNQKDAQKEDVISVKSSPKQTKTSVQKQTRKVSSLEQDPCPVQKEKLHETISTTCGEETNENKAPANNAASSPRTRSQRDAQIETLEIAESDGKQSDDSRKSLTTRSISLRKRKDPLEPKGTDSSDAGEQSPACNAVTQDVNEGVEEASPVALTAEGLPVSVQNEYEVTTRSSRSKASEGKAFISSAVEIACKGLAASKRNPMKQSNLTRQSPPESPQEEKCEKEFPIAESSPVNNKKSKKPSEYLVRVVSTDQNSSSSERSESPKRQNKKTISEVDKAKEDTSSICSESSSIESSSASSFSSRTVSSKSSKKSSTSSTSSSSSTSSTSTTLSDAQGRNTRSRRPQQVALHSSDNNPPAANEEQTSTEPNSESSEQSLKRGKVKTTSSTHMTSKERAKLVQRRRSIRTNRFLLNDECNESSSESSETSGTTRITRTSRSKSRCDVASAFKKSEDASSSIVLITESKDDSESSQEQQTVVKGLGSRSTKKSGRFAPLKGMSPERAANDDNSLSNSTMRETRARRKTISSASELEELLDHRISRATKHKNQIKGKKPLPLEEKENLKEDKESDVAETIGAEVEAEISAVDVEKPDNVAAGADTDKGETILNQNAEATKNVDRKSVDKESGEQMQSIKVACGPGSPKCKVSVKNIDMETLLTSSPKGTVNKPEDTTKGKIVAEIVKTMDYSENKLEEDRPACILDVVHAERNETINAPTPEKISGSSDSEKSQSVEDNEDLTVDSNSVPKPDEGEAEVVTLTETTEENVDKPVALSDGDTEDQGDEQNSLLNSQSEQIPKEIETVPLSEDDKQQSTDEKPTQQDPDNILTEEVEIAEKDKLCVSDPVVSETECMISVNSPDCTSAGVVEESVIEQHDMDVGLLHTHDNAEEPTRIESDSESIVNSVCEEKSKNENRNGAQVPANFDKGAILPGEETNFTQYDVPKSTQDEEEINKSLSNEVCVGESSNSSDSLKSDNSKPDTLEPNSVDLLQKSLTKPSSTKKLPKKKDKQQPTPTTAKDKEDLKKSKKNQADDLKKVETTASPKSRKKQTELAKSEKKAETEAPNKRKTAAKNKIADTPKPLEASESKIEVPENKATDVPLSVVDENTVFTLEAAAQQKEVPCNPPKLMKSKGETKFYPDEHPKEDNQTTDTSSSDDMPKENSPDLVPDPLKDIEKFIEDGVNLLKRGYKLDENEESVESNDVAKAADTTTAKKCKLDENSEDKKQTPSEDDNSNSNSNSEQSNLASTHSSDVDTPNGIRRSHRIKNNSKSTKCLVGRGLVRDRERFSMKDDEKTVYSIDDQKMDLAEVEAKNSKFLKDMEERLSNFRVIRENEYKCERVISKEAKRMLCDCFLTAEEEERGELGCGEDCLNRLLMIECGSDCTVKERCTNRRFTKFLYSPCRVFRTEKKGFGIMADIEILPGEFIMEYVGEVIDGDEFERRRNVYSQDKNKHYYFMALRSDAIIDATAKGNVSRFINHSCDPNAETQKWTVNGELRIGFFSRKSIMPGEEITFDYQYQRYGKEAQKCYCESSNCRGWIGEEPSSGEEGEEEEIDEEEEGETESEEEEDQEAVPTPTIPFAGPQTMPQGEQLVSEAPTADKDVQPSELLPVFTQVTAEAAKPAKEIQPKKKKERRRQLDRKDDKIKRREAKQFLEDPDIEDEVRFLVKCGLKNQADTLRLSRLIVRAKLLETRLNLLQILRAGELPCRRLFLDYHGLRLLHGWMSEVIDTRDTEKSMEIRMALLRVLECLPISNKTMLTDSKVYQTVRDWSNNKESHSPSDESSKDGTTPAVPPSSPTRTDQSSTELQKLAAKLVSTWDNLPEIFRIPKRERIEQMKEHEREADRQYKGLGEDVSGSDEHRNRDRFIRSGPNSSRFKWSRSDKDKERERTGDRRRYLLNGGSGKDGVDKTQGLADSHLSKEQRRELFAAKVARDEAEKRLAEERREFDIKCRFFGLDPKRMRPENMPFCVNPSTGQWYSTDKKPISTPPSYAHVQVPVKPKSTNPADYQLPIMDLPPLWKFAISPKGRIYYYHVKIRIPQWEHPIKILPLAGKKNTNVKTSESDSSNADCADSSDDDIDVIKGLDPVKLKAYVEKKIEDRRLQRYNRLVEEKPISPRKEEDRIYNQIEVRKYKENKEKIRKRKEEIRRRRDTMAKVGVASIETNQPEQTAEDDDEVAVNALPIQDYLLSSDEEDKIKEECNNSPLIDKIVQGDKIVDELDALQCKRPLKRALPIREKYEHKKRKMDKNKESTKSTKRSKDGEGGSSSSSSSSKYRKIREKFRCEIAGIIVQHLRPYRKETCFSGRILTDDDFNHLARKLTHFVMVKELKYCESIGQTLVVTESVKNKSREFIKKYMAKYGAVYVRPKNDPEFKEIPFL